MKLEITTSAKNIEAANMILADVIRDLKEEGSSHGYTDKDLNNAEAFRESLLKAFLK